MRNVILVATFFFLWISSQLDPVFQDYLAYALILSFGVLHGANDITLIATISKENQRVKPVFVAYLGAIAFVSLFFLISKALALLFFIVISAYHFGEQHFGQSLVKKTNLRFALFLNYGMVILFMIFTIRINKVISVIYDVTSVMIPEVIFRIVFLLVSMASLILTIHLIRKEVLKINPLKELFYLVILALVFANSSLIWGFATYFILWHSLPSLNEQLSFIYGKASARNFLKYVKSSALYWFVSIAGLALLYLLLKDQVDYFITVVLYVLAAITFPHVVVMSKIEAIKNSPES